MLHVSELKDICHFKLIIKLEAHRDPDLCSICRERKTRVCAERGIYARYSGQIKRKGPARSHAAAKMKKCPRGRLLQAVARIRRDSGTFKVDTPEQRKDGEPQHLKKRNECRTTRKEGREGDREEGRDEGKEGNRKGMTKK